MRTRSVLLACLGILLGGAASAAAEPMTFANRPVGQSAGEPTLGINKDGTIFFQAMLKVMRSNDEGLHWIDVYESPFGQTLDPFIHVDVPTGRVISSQLLGACQLLAISDDAGQTWTDLPTQCGTGDHQKLGSGPATGPGAGALFPRTFITCTNKVAMTSCATSPDGGRTWLPEVMVYPGADPGAENGVNGVSGVCGGLLGDPVSGPDGTLYLPREYCGRPYVAVSTDGGLTWTLKAVSAPSQTRPIQYGANNPTVAVAPNGTLWYAWTGDDWRHHVGRSTDQGTTWKTWTIEAGIKSTTFPYIIAGPNGVATSFVGTRDSDAGPDGAPAKSNWHLFVSTLTDPGAAEPQWETTQVTPGNDPVNIGCIGRHGGSCAGHTGMLDFNDMAFTPDGRIAISYTDACVKPACKDANTSGGEAGVLAIQTAGPKVG
jgi:hypothetical protein